MSKPRSWYLPVAAGVFLGNLLIGVIDERRLELRIVVKALLAAFVALALLIWWDRRRSTPSNTRD